MNSELLLANVGAWSLQALVLIALGDLLPRPFRPAHPRARLLWYSALLAVALALPWIQPWRLQPAFATNLAMAPGAPSAGVAALDATPAWIWQDYVLLVLAAGAVARLAWLGLGLLRLSQYRAGAIPTPAPETVVRAGDLTGTTAQVAVSPAISVPVTFGFWRPVVLLPPGFLTLAPAQQLAIAAHEFTHVRRAHWLFALAEEAAAAVCWFHPGIWFAISRIRLAREQSVDHEVLALTAAREPYVDALVAMAGGAATAAATAAPSFLYDRHLALRVHSLLEEKNMPMLKLIPRYALPALALYAATWWTAGQFPLAAEPQFAESGANGVQVAVTGAETVLRKPVAYPSAARVAGVEGQVLMDVTIAANGSVADARVVAGPEELRRAALESILGWQFKAEGGRRQAQVSATFVRDGAEQPPAGIIAKVQIGDLPAPVMETLRARLSHVEGQKATPSLMAEIQQTARAVFEGATMRVEYKNGETVVQIGAGFALPVERVFPVPAPGDVPRLRIGGNVQASKLIHKVPPQYPALAKQARIQGTVRFSVLIAADGGIKEMQLVSGHPLLVQDAQTAVQQWRYATTLLNGKPVEVITQIDVNFTLAP